MQTPRARSIYPMEAYSYNSDCSKNTVIRVIHAPDTHLIHAPDIRAPRQLAEKIPDSTPLEPAKDILIKDRLREDCTTEAFTPRSIYPESCISEGSMNTVIHVIQASDMEPISPRSDVSFADFWRRSTCRHYYTYISRSC